jgi:hypothetical protein
MREYNFGFHKTEADREIINRIAEYMLESIEAYIQNGRPVGDCLRAIISNNLMESIGRADKQTRNSLYEICAIFYNYAPADCHGSMDKYINWIKRGGIDGIRLEIIDADIKSGLIVERSGIKYKIKAINLAENRDDDEIELSSIQSHSTLAFCSRSVFKGPDSFYRLAAPRNKTEAEEEE